MDPRRHLIALAALTLPLAGLTACASAPAPTIAAQTPPPIQLVASAPIAALRPFTPPALHWVSCGSIRKTAHHRHGAVRRCSRTVVAALRQVAMASPPRRLSAARPMARATSVPIVASLRAPPVPQTVAARSPTPPPLVPANPPHPPAPTVAAASPVSRSLRMIPASVPVVVDHREGAIQVFAYTSGRVYAVRTAPLRITALQLQPGETLIDKAAGDTVRWEIGETTSGTGDNARSLVIIKPLTAGLSTNLVLTTTRRVYLIDLTSGHSAAMSTAIGWAYADPPRPVVPAALPAAFSSVADGEVSSRRYRIAPQGRRPAWTPVSVFDDGRKTFVAFAPGLDRGPSPLLFVRDAGQPRALINYRQQGDVYVVDRLFDEAELTLGDGHPERVRISRIEEGSR